MRINHFFNFKVSIIAIPNAIIEIIPNPVKPTEEYKIAPINEPRVNPK